MTEHVEQTSASDRYEAARAALAEYDEHTEPRSISDQRRREYRLAAALRALITPPVVGESAESVAREYLGPYPSDVIPSEQVFDLLVELFNAGIQSAHETWEPEVAQRPSQEQMLRWLGLDHSDTSDEPSTGVLIYEQIIDKETL